MSESQQSPLRTTLIEISKIDVVLMGLVAQKKQIENDLVQRRQSIAHQEARRTARAKLLDEKRGLVTREEKNIKVERERLNDRRRALNTLNNYKLQQAAEREIDYTSKQLSQREDLLLTVMREVEILEKEVGELEGALKGLQDEFVAFERDASESLQSIEVRTSDYSKQRAEQTTIIGQPALMTTYDRVRNRYPMNPLVTIANRDSCTGCHQKLGPQPIVQVSRGEIVKCPGCGRILRLGEDA